MYQVLYRKYRPQLLDDVCGQDTIVKIIKNSINTQTISHAYLFSGPRGTGKTSLAKIFAKLVNCENLKDCKPCEKCVSCSQTNNSDIIEIDAASNNGVDEIRELKNRVNLVPAYGKYKVYIIDEVHMLTTGAFNALLKTLEEPPTHAIFILATTDPHKIPETIVSRCQRLDFKRISEKSIIKRLKEIAKKEKISIDDDALEEIAYLAEGGMRDSIGILDQARAYSAGKINVQDIHDINGTLTSKEIHDFVFDIINNKLDEILKKIDSYNESGKNFVKITEEIILFLRNVLISDVAFDYLKETNSNYEIYKDFTSVKIEEILKYIDVLNEGLSSMKNNSNTKLILELSCIKMLNNVNQIEKEIDINKEKKVEKEKTIVKEDKKINKEITKVEKNNSNISNLKELQELRIENTLAGFQKKELVKIKKQLEKLNDLLLNPDYSKYASIILDGKLKAASDKNLIYVYQNERLAALFNENLNDIEKTIDKVLEKKYKVIATDEAAWEIIKEEFNSKKRKYVYKEEKDIKIKKEKEKVNDELKDFEEIIEYK